MTVKIFVRVVKCVHMEIEKKYGQQNKKWQIGERVRENINRVTNPSREGNMIF